MLHFSTIVYFLFLVCISLTDTRQLSRPIRIPRIRNNPCFDQEVGTFVKNRYYCHKFYYCAPSGIAIPVDCPHRMIFNADKEICDFPSNYFCIPERKEEDDLDYGTVPGNEQTTSTVPPTKPTVITDGCPVDDNQGLVYLSDENECHRYYICYHGFPIQQECIKELHWNQKLGRCDFPENAGCLIAMSTTLSPVTPTPTTTRTTATVVPEAGIAVAISCPFRGEQIIPHPEECNYFIYCINGFATVQQCPFFHHYDILSKSCMWQTRAKCIVRKDERNIVRRPAGRG